MAELTYDERARWTVCPVCGAEVGEWCDGGIGISLGLNVNGQVADRGAHLARLNAAPTEADAVPVALFRTIAKEADRG